MFDLVFDIVYLVIIEVRWRLAVKALVQHVIYERRGMHGYNIFLFIELWTLLLFLIGLSMFFFLNFGCESTIISQ